MKTMRLIYSCICLLISMNSFGFQYFCVKTEAEYLWGLKDSTGTVLCEPKYHVIFDFHDDRAVVIKDNLYGVIDKKGNEIIPLSYDYISNFNHNVASVINKGLLDFDYKYGTRWNSKSYSKFMNPFSHNDVKANVLRKDLLYVNPKNDSAVQAILQKDIKDIKRNVNKQKVYRERKEYSYWGYIYYIDTNGIKTTQYDDGSQIRTVRHRNENLSKFSCDDWCNKLKELNESKKLTSYYAYEAEPIRFIEKYKFRKGNYYMGYEIHIDTVIFGAFGSAYPNLDVMIIPNICDQTQKYDTVEIINVFNDNKTKERNVILLGMQRYYRYFDKDIISNKKIVTIKDSVWDKRFHIWENSKKINNINYIAWEYKDFTLTDFKVLKADSTFDYYYVNRNTGKLKQITKQIYNEEFAFKIEPIHYFIFQKGKTFVVDSGTKTVSIYDEKYYASQGIKTFDKNEEKYYKEGYKLIATDGYDIRKKTFWIDGVGVINKSGKVIVSSEYFSPIDKYIKDNTVYKTIKEPIKCYDHSFFAHSNHGNFIVLCRNEKKDSIINNATKKRSNKKKAPHLTPNVLVFNLLGEIIFENKVHLAWSYGDYRTYLELKSVGYFFNDDKFLQLKTKNGRIIINEKGEEIVKSDCTDYEIENNKIKAFKYIGMSQKSYDNFWNQPILSSILPSFYNYTETYTTYEYLVGWYDMKGNLIQEPTSIYLYETETTNYYGR